MHTTPAITYNYIARNKKQTSCQLHEDGITFTQNKKNEREESHKYKYTQISRIHLGYPDTTWYTIDIYFNDSTHIHLKSLTFFIQQEDGKLRRAKTKKQDIAIFQQNQKAYREFVIALHEAILSSSNHDIKFTHGNPGKKILIWIFLILIIIWIPILLEINQYKLSITMALAFLYLILFNLKINFKKTYQAEQIPQKYLPVS